MSQIRKVGRPSIGAPVTMHFPAPLIHALDELAGELHISRSELVRRSCQSALQACAARLTLILQCNQAVEGHTLRFAC